MARTHGRAPKGERVVGYVPRNGGDRVTLIAALTVEGIQAPMFMKGSMTTVAFEGYVEHFLGPKLHPGHIVVMDNLSAHRSARAQQLIEEKGAHLWRLPPYSPDLHPIEWAWSKVKTLLRAAAARGYDALLEAVAKVLPLISSSDALAWMKLDGYSTPIY